MRKSGLLLPAQLFLETRPRPKGWGFFLRPGAQTRSTNREFRNKHEWLNPARLETGSRESWFEILRICVLDLSRISTLEFRTSGPWPVSLRLNGFLNTKPRWETGGAFFLRPFCRSLCISEQKPARIEHFSLFFGTFWAVSDHF
jgi:hypothetical protein